MSRIWTSPPTVYDVEIPRIHKMMRIPAMVINMRYWLVLNVDGQVTLSFPLPSRTYTT